jgi:two-component system, chemotaxis family, sensor kinase CheA
MDDLLREFLAETSESLAVLDSDLVRLEKSPDPALLQGIFRLFHTIKGTCGFLGLPRLEALAHAAETVLGRIRDGELAPSPDVVSAIFGAIDRIRAMLAQLDAHGREFESDDAPLIARLGILGGETAPPASMPPSEVPPAPPTHDSALAEHSIRVNVALLDTLMTLVSELVLTRNQLLQVLRGETKSAFAGPLQRLSQLTSELQEGVMKTRMQPIGGAWSKLPRLVRDLARELDKKIELKLSGAETELDRHVLELIRDPLTHMVRNAADHGIESLAERKRSGKAETARITLDAHHEGGHIVIEIADDGRGLALDKIKARALAMRLASESELRALSEQQLRQIIFRPGFSTADAVTAVSGRGVGLDVVRSNIERLGGTVEAVSSEGKGTRFTIALPLTLTIVAALIVESGGERFALPQAAVIELVNAGVGSERKIERLNRTAVLRLRNRLLPLVSLRQVLALDGDETGESGLVVVTEVAGRNFGIIVDRVFDVEEIVVKPVAPVLRGIPIFAGNTILGDGRVILILDPAGIAAANGGIGVIPAGAAPSLPSAREAPDRSMSFLLFRAGPGGLKAVPLGVVSRLEEIDLAAVETAEGRPVVQYGGRLMPLVTLAPDAPLAPAGRRPVLVFLSGGGVMGLVADEIVDIVDETLAFERMADRPGLLGSAIVAGKATDIIDVSFYLKRERVARPAQAATSKPRRILLVEASPFYRNLLTPLLGMAGYDVTSVESADRALALRAAGEDFDVIVGDGDGAAMPDFAARMREGSWRETPLVALAEALPADAAPTRQAGFAGAVAKLDREALLGGIARACEQSKDAA